MISEDTLEQRRAGTRHADDEDWHRPVESVRGHSGEVAVAARDYRIEQGLFVLGLVFQALMHHRIGALQRGPGVVMTAQVLEFLVLRELESGVVLGSLFNRLQPAPDEIQVIVIDVPCAQSRKRQ